MQSLTALTFGLAIAQIPGASLCDGPARPFAPSRDLYCIELIAAPRIVGASGRVELLMRPGPFTVDVTPSGVLRFSPVITLAGLPAPASLGPYSTYVAWLTTPVMDQVHRLGEVRNGRAQLPAIDLDKFIILITAETSAKVSSPGGSFVLRGVSPSTRLQPADLMQFTVGAIPSRTRTPSTSTCLRKPLGIPPVGRRYRCRRTSRCFPRRWRFALRSHRICHPLTCELRARDRVS